VYNHDYVMIQMAKIRQEEIRKEFQKVNRRGKARKWVQILRSVWNTYDQCYPRYVKSNLTCCAAPSCGG